MDAFYASIEQRERPDLCGRAVIVGADPRGRGVVSTCSYEARVFGVRSAMPIREAYRRCPGGVFLPVRMGLYAEVSARIMEILDEFSPAVEPLSVDEAFLDVSGCEGFHRSFEAMGRALKARILEVTRLPCSVGIAPNKFLAKLATELGKPDGLTIIPRDRIAGTLDPLPVERVFGVGPRTTALLAGMGIRTMGELTRTPRDRLVARLGAAAADHMLALARGDDLRDVDPARRQKQLGAERTFAFDLEDTEPVRRQILDLSLEVGAQLRRRRFRGRTLRLKLRTEDFVTRTRSRTLATPTDSGRVLYRHAWDLYREDPPDRPVRLVGVTAADLVDPDHGLQGRLFAPDGEDTRAVELEKAADRIRSRFGSEALRPASLVAQPRDRGQDR